MTQRPFEIPSWAPVAALAVLVVWAASIWWMVANLETGGDTSALHDGVNTLQGEMETLATRVDALSSEVSRLLDERAALLDRVDDLEGQALVAAAQAEAVDEEPAVEEHPLYTAGRDLYNCRAFASWDEAQEALRVNGPGDPNHIDTNGNGIACEDIKFGTTTASPPPAATPVATATQQGITAE